MLLAVEGGGFFSSSASGYSKGLTLLLLGRKSEEKHMRVTPWNHYQLVDEEGHPHLQLASGKNCLVPGCASFACLGNSAGVPEGQSPPKVELTRNTEVVLGCLDFDESKEKAHSVDTTGDDDRDRQIDNSLKSTLKKSVSTAGERENDVTCRKKRKKVQWPDAVEGELFEMREFEMSEDESGNEFDPANGKACACRIM